MRLINGKFQKLEYNTENSARICIFENGELADLNNDGWLDFIGFHYKIEVNCLLKAMVLTAEKFQEVRKILF